MQAGGQAGRRRAGLASAEVPGLPRLLQGLVGAEPPVSLHLPTRTRGSTFFIFFFSLWIKIKSNPPEIHSYKDDRNTHPTPGRSRTPCDKAQRAAASSSSPAPAAVKAAGARPWRLATPFPASAEQLDPARAPPSTPEAVWFVTCIYFNKLLVSSNGVATGAGDVPRLNREIPTRFLGARRSLPGSCALVLGRGAQGWPGEGRWRLCDCENTNPHLP